MCKPLGSRVSGPRTPVQIVVPGAALERIVAVGSDEHVAARVSDQQGCD